MTIVDLVDPPSSCKAVLLFWAPWHEDSVSLMESVIPALAESTGKDLLFGCVEAEAQPALSEMYQVTVVPTFVFVGADGKVVERIEGTVEISQVTQAVQRLVGMIHIPTKPAVTSVSAKEALDDRLSRLVKSSDVMLFMKGSPTAPRCGFSRQVVEILSEAKIGFGSFDILTDEEVRQGLKDYSDWPTYPQLYVKGELVGGLDILKEMLDDKSTPLVDQLGVAPEPTLEERLSKLINRHRIMIFMKGVPSAPQCGFSRQIVAMLDQEGVAYDAFNILEDEEVRQGLKKFSEWPTYPQLYVDGDLIGGLDICKEMADSGDLTALLNG
jgi:Grx4 family monothiol glutaredoxin